MAERKRSNGFWDLVKILLVLLVIYFGFPIWLKWDKEKIYEKDGITVYASDSVNQADLAKVMDKAQSLLNKYGKKSNKEITYVICDTRNEFRIRNFFISSDALAMNWIPTNYITFNRIDFANDKLSARLECLNQRSASSVIAHEYVHTYQLSQLGFLKYRIKSFKELWKIEGMAELVSETSSLPSDMGLKMLMSGNEESVDEEIKGEFFYFKSHLKADYLLGYKQVSEETFWDTKYDDDMLLVEIREAIRKGEYRPNW